MNISKQNTRSDYIFLLSWLTSWLLLYSRLSHRPEWQIIITGVMAIGYIGWGYWHHWRAKTLYNGVMWEYTTFGLLAIAMVIGVLRFF